MTNHSAWIDHERWRDPNCIECGGEGAPCCQPPDGPPPPPDMSDDEQYLRWWANPEQDPLLAATVERAAARAVLAEYDRLRAERATQDTVPPPGVQPSSGIPPQPYSTAKHPTAVKKFVPYLHKFLFTVIAVANMALAAWAFAVHGKADATVLLWIVVCLGLAQMSVLHREFVEMTKANEKAMGIIQTNVDRVLKHEAFRSHGGAR